jgi:hypothetical protein
MEIIRLSPMAGKYMKTVDDVTREEWIALAEAASNLLGCARFMFWLDGSGSHDPEDGSVRDSLNKMASALESVGLPQGTIEEFDANIEAMMKSGKSLAEWAATRESK